MMSMTSSDEVTRAHEDLFFDLRLPDIVAAVGAAAVSSSTSV